MDKTLKNLFNPPQNHSASYKAVDETTVSLTEEEKNKVLKDALYSKIAKMNNANYLKAISYTPTFNIPKVDDLLDVLTNELKNIYGWELDQYNEDVIRKLCFYFSNDARFESLEEGFSLKKGLLIPGPVGCGKTTLLSIFSKNSANPYRIISARTIAEQYAEFGASAIQQYSAIQTVPPLEWYGNNKLGLCIDDMGTEQIKKNFGNELNVITEIILNRYDLKIDFSKTHITTNIAADEIKDHYGVRASSRMREMLNIIAFPFDAPDRRK